KYDTIRTFSTQTNKPHTQQQQQQSQSQTFLLLAKDGRDPQALQRRLSVRESHLLEARKYFSSGKLLLGGATLSLPPNSPPTMNGSMCIFETKSKSDLQDLIKNDPYVTGNVWQHTEISPFRLARLRNGISLSTGNPQSKNRYLIIARDFTDSEALNRRLKVREHHLARAKQSFDNGMLILGGAMLRESDGVMNGSVLMVEIDVGGKGDANALEGLEEAKKWAGEDVYVKGGVWESVEVLPFKVAPLG
ncbi:hypothetical protein HDU76_012256, partial [Blyttiomyces sp. JEL0837]